MNIDIQKIKHDSVLSFTHRIMRGSYVIFVNERLMQSVQDILILQETARIKCAHFLHEPIQGGIAKSFFQKYFNKNKSSIMMRLPEDKSTISNISKMTQLSSYIFERFAAIAKSMEVNSRIFKDNWDDVKPSLLGAIKMQSVTFSFESENKYLSFPQDDWQTGLSWNLYMHLLCLNMDVYLDKITDSLEGCSGRGKIRTSDISAYSSGQDSLKKIFDDYTRCDTRIKKGRTTNLSGADSSCSVGMASSFNDLLNILRQSSFNEEKRKVKTDIMFNTNRNKLKCSTLIPHRTMCVKKTPAAICILLDVSGSIDALFLQRVVRTIIKAQGLFDKKKSRLVCWSDYLCSDSNFEDLGVIRKGGGTLLKEGIEYCKKYFSAAQREKAKFFIISDFQDEIDDWIKAAVNIKAKKTAIAYTKGEKAGGIDFKTWFYGIGSNANSHKQQTTIKEFSDVFDVFLLNM